jgi:membrane carboxypeptidase/penicillin-binding protein PbpC
LAASGAAAAYVNFHYWHNQQPAEFFLQRLAARVRPGVFGPTGEWLGVIPPAKDAIFQLDRVGVQMTDVPQDFCRLLLRLEDSHAGQWYRGHVAGVDWAAVPVRFMSGLLPGRKPTGASTIWMQIASMAGGFKTQYPKVQRKLREYAGAAELFVAMGGDVGRAVLAYASIAPYARGIGGDVIGLVAAADVLYGKTPDQLTLAQLAILASAPNQPLWIGEDSARARASFSDIKHRAILALQAEFDLARSQPAVAEIKATGDLPPVRPQIANLAAAVTGTVEGRTRAFVLPVLPAIRTDLHAILDEEASHAVASR